MRLVSFEGGFGRIEAEVLIPMGEDLVAYLNEGSATEGEPVTLSQVKLSAPIPRPGKVLCVGLNYLDHASETGNLVPEEPVIFGKFANSVVGPGAEVVVPPAATAVDYEAELGVVIGRRAREVTVDTALSYVGGYLCANDVSSRTLQFQTGQWMIGKAVDNFLPIGPALVSVDEVPDPQMLTIRCWVNGDLRQDSKTADMIFSVAEIISYLSRTITLEPGDVIATGTPAGVGMSYSPARYLHAGDEVAVEIEGIGRLTNTFRWR